MLQGLATLAILVLAVVCAVGIPIYGTYFFFFSQTAQSYRGLVLSIGIAAILLLLLAAFSFHRLFPNCHPTLPQRFWTYCAQS